MADTTAKRLNQASRIVSEIDQFVTALYRAQQIANEIASAGLVYSDEDFTNTGLAHLTAANLGSAISAITATVDELESTFRDDVLNAVRP